MIVYIVIVNMVLSALRQYAYTKSKVKARIEARPCIGWSKRKSLRSRNDVEIEI